MEVSQTIKQEKVDYLITEPDVNFETNILDSLELKLEPIKIEPHSNVPEPNNLVKKCNLMEEAKIIGNNDKYMFSHSLKEQKVSEIKFEERDKEKLEDIFDIKWKIKNEESNIKDEINIEDEEQWKPSTLVCRQQQRETSAASSSENNISGDNYFRCKECKYKTTQKRYLNDNLKLHEKFLTMLKCEFCEFKTIFKIRFIQHFKRHNKDFDKVNIMYKCVQCDYKKVCKQGLKKHNLKHKKIGEVDVYKCYQCNYQTINKEYLKSHCLKHKKIGEVDVYECDQCEFQTIHKQSLEKKSLQHKKVDEVHMYKCDKCEFQTIHKQNLTRHTLSLNHIKFKEVHRFIPIYKPEL